MSRAADKSHEYHMMFVAFRLDFPMDFPSKSLKFQHLSLYLLYKTINKNERNFKIWVN